MKQVVPLEIGICTPDIDRLLPFYTKLLGCEPVGDVAVPTDKAKSAGLSTAGYRVVRLQTPYGERIKLLQPETPAEAPVISAFVLDRYGMAYMTFIVSDLDAVVKKLQKAGVNILSGEDKVEVRPGTFLLFCEDPDGNIVEFVQYDDVKAYRPDVK